MRYDFKARLRVRSPNARRVYMPPCYHRRL